MVQRARELDPLNAWVWAMCSYCLTQTNGADEAIAASRQAVAFDRENFAARWIQVWTFAAVGNVDQATGRRIEVGDVRTRSAHSD